jgi:hypothetical protein
MVAAARSRGRWLLVNTSTGIGTSSLAVADAVGAVTGRKVRVGVLPEQVGEPARAVADPAAGTKRMGWSPAVGLTEDQAREAGYAVKTSVLPLELVPRALVNGETAGLIKLVADAESDRLLGAHVLAEHAGEVIQAATLAVKFGLTVADLTGTFHPYLTIAEGLKLAAQTFERDVAKLSCCAA